MSMLTHHLLFDHSQLALIHGPNIPGSYAILFFTASDFTSTIISHIHNWALFSLWLHIFILSGVISPFSRSILDTDQPGEFIFQCHIFLPFHIRMEYNHFPKSCQFKEELPHFVKTSQGVEKNQGLWVLMLPYK